MGKNVEIKAKVTEANFPELCEVAAGLATRGPEQLVQTDTFFHSTTGRLKLREFADGSAELIGYHRPDAEGPKTSDYVLASCDGAAIKAALAMTIGIAGVVKKQRTVYFLDQTRIHLDRVEVLGTFLELEVVLAEDQLESKGVEIANSILGQLGLSKNDLVSGAYFDLLTG